MTVFEQLKELIAQSVPEIDIATVTPESSLKNDLGLDSLSTMMISMLIEEKFGFNFDGEINFETVCDLCEYIEKMI